MLECSQCIPIQSLCMCLHRLHYLIAAQIFHIYIYICVVLSISFQTFLYRNLKLSDSWKFSMLLLYILWDDWLTFMIQRFKWTATAGFVMHPTKPWLSQLVNFKNAIWTWGRTICNKILFETGKKCHAMKAGSTAMTQRPRDRVPSRSMLAFPDPRRPDRANPPSNFWQH